MNLQTQAETIERLLRLQVNPLGISFLKPGQDPEKGFARPAKYGIRISLCQWVTMARRWGRPLAVLAEDVNCSPCLAALGLKKMQTDQALADYIFDMGYTATHELAAKAAAELDVLPAGEIGGLMAYPLAQADQEPDLVVIYGTPAQMARLAAGLVYSSGELVPARTSGFGISCLAMVKPHWSGRPAMVIPGRGERILAGTEEQEMLCSFPARLLDSLVEGLTKTQEKGNRYPIQRYLLYEPPVLPAMKALDAKMD